ncbi:MAG TPA: amino acid adenylation domain-containing protein [Terriglobales bacterium]
MPSGTQREPASMTAQMDLASEPSASGTVHALFETQAERTPDATAVTQSGESLTYRELNARANQLARFLIASGVQTEDRIGVALLPSLNLPVALLGALKAGCACLPLDLNYPQERLTLMLDDSRPALVLTESDVADRLAFAKTKLVSLDTEADNIFRGASSNLDLPITSENLAYVIYTSGSTGRPRGVLLPHRGLANHNQSSIELYDLTPDDRVLQMSSISFDIAVEEIFPALAAGATLVLKDEAFSLQADEFLHWIGDQRISVLDLPTAFWHELVHQMSATPGATLPTSLRMVILGGEKGSTKVFRAWQKISGNRVRLINTYGPTEASVIVSAFEPARFPDAELGDSLPLGLPACNATIILLDEDLKPVPQGTPGELHIGGPPLARGYLNHPDLTAKKFIPDPFSEDPSARLYKTGDMARYAPNGQLEFMGRVDFQVKIRGFRVEPGEIEAVLHKYPNLAEAVVISHEHANGDKSLAAYTVWAAGHAPASHAELHNFLKQRLPEYMIPSAFVTMQRLPLTVNGKVDRKALPRPDLAPVSTKSTAVPQDELQAKLIGIWQSVLGRKDVGIDDNFFEMGGYSILAARLMHRVGQAMGSTLPLALLFQAPTVAKMSALLQRDGWSSHWSSLVAIQPSGSKPPIFCVHGVGGNVLNLRPLSRRLGADYPLYGLQAQGLDGRQPCLTSIEDMAAHYIKEIRTIQPEGPYLLGGYSLGGVIAYEMAQQLTANGEEVALVALLDSYPGNVKPETNRLLDLLRSPQRLLLEMPAAAWESIQRKVKRGRVNPALKKVFLQNTDNADRYVLRPYDGKVALFRAKDKSWRGTDPYEHWATLAPKLETHEVPGDHRELLYEPRVAHLADSLRARIDAIVSSYEPAQAS